MEKNVHVYAEIRKGMYRIPQAGQIETISLPKLSHHMNTNSVGTHSAYVGTNGEQWFFLWYCIT